MQTKKWGQKVNFLVFGLFITVIFMRSECAFGWGFGVQDPSQKYSYNVDPILLEKFKTAIQSHIFYFPSSVSMFNYSGMRTGVSAESIKPSLADGGEFWNSKNNFPMGNTQGYYFAFTPSQTQIFGGSNPLLTEVILPRGTKALMMFTNQDYGHMRFDSDLSKQLANLGCPGTWEATFISNAASVPCRDLVRASLRDLQIEILLYKYLSMDGVKGMGCVDFTENSAAILLPASYAKSREFRYFSRVTPNNDPWPEDRYAFSRFDQILNAPIKMWPALTPPENFDLQNWVRQKIWGCGAEFKKAKAP